MRNTMLSTLLPSALGVLMLISSPARAEEVKTAYFRYTNKGGYTVRLRLKVKDKKTGEVKEVGLKGECWQPTQGRMIVGEADGNLVDINETAVCMIDEDRDEIGHGDEVWPVLHIRSGETKSCRKDSTKLIVGHVGSNQNVAAYHSKGTTNFGNRCRFDGIKTKK